MAGENTANYEEQGGDNWAIGGTITILSGGRIVPASGTGAAAITVMTDSTGGTANDTLAAITAGASYAQADMTAVKNALATLAAKVNALIAANQGVGITG